MKTKQRSAGGSLLELVVIVAVALGLALGIQAFLVGSPRQPIHSGCGTALERQERIPQQIDCHVVQQRGELALLPLPCSLSNTVQPL